MNFKPCTGIWLLLLALTGLTYTVAELGLGGPVIVAMVLVIAVVKGQLVVDRFMGLKWVPLQWRGLLFGYLLLVCGLIGLAYRAGNVA